MNTKISYLYRDACNYKQHNEAVVNGTFTEQDIKAVLDSLNEGIYFIPSQVGLPEKRFEETTEDDHCWFELDSDGFIETNEPATVDITAKELAEAFAAAKRTWDDSCIWWE